MELYEFNNKIETLAEKNNIYITDEQKEQLYKYMNLLIEWNKKMNLTAITEPNDIMLKHFVDSASINQYLSEANNMIDVGTGAGFPGMVLKILNPNVEITLLDALNKRINFLNEVINKNNLLNVNTIHARAEEIGQNIEYREKYDVVVSRAVANMSLLLEYMLPLTKIEGLCICMKAIGVEEELSQSKNAIEILGGVVEKVEIIDIKGFDGNLIKREIIVIRKKKSTPEKYPRSYNKINKKPLK